MSEGSCAGTISRLHKVLKFQPLQSIVQLCSLGKEAPKCESPFFWNVQNMSLPPQAHHECHRPWCVSLAPQLGSWEDHPHQNIGSQPKSLLITVFSAGTEFTFLTVAWTWNRSSRLAGWHGIVSLSPVSWLGDGAGMCGLEKHPEVSAFSPQVFLDSHFPLVRRMGLLNIFVRG